MSKPKTFLCKFIQIWHIYWKPVSSYIGTQIVTVRKGTYKKLLFSILETVMSHQNFLNLRQAKPTVILPQEVENVVVLFSLR